MLRISKQNVLDPLERNRIANLGLIFSSDTKSVSFLQASFGLNDVDLDIYFC
jgi:hypothetical protein